MSVITRYAVAARAARWRWLTGSVLLALAMTGCECGDSHLRDAAVDAGVDGSDGSDAGTRSDGSVFEPRCDLDPAGTWTRTFVRSRDRCYPDHDDSVVLGSDGLIADEVGHCAGDGCTADNCRVEPAAAPECTAVWSYESPCTGLSIGVRARTEHRIVGPTRIEGRSVISFELDECVFEYVLTR